MPRGLGHERMRWEKMTPRQLLRRLGRITTQEKLLNFITVARERGARLMESLGRRRFTILLTQQPQTQDFSGFRTAPTPQRQDFQGLFDYEEVTIEKQAPVEKGVGLRVIRFRKKEESSG